MGLMNTLFGGTKQVSTLTKGQNGLLNQLSGLQNQYNGNTYAGLNAIANNPNNAYEYNADNGAAAFQSNIINPALRQMNTNIANTMHSSNLHSSANRTAQDNVRQNTMDNLNNLSYQNMMNQQKLKQEGQESAYGRQLQSLSQLLGGNSSVLGTQGTALSKAPGLFDVISGVGNAIGSVKSLF